MKFILKIGLISFFSVFACAAIAQAPKPLDRNINHPSYNVVYPAVSGDGRVMVFMTDYSDDGDFAMMMSKYRGGKWQDAEDADIIGSAKVNNWGGYSLNYDGTGVFFSSRRSNGVGKYDLWMSNYVDGEWSKPTNIGKPVNSTGNEGNPSISPDEQRIYFMRCESMSNSDVSGCKIYYSDNGSRGWQEPVEMPDYINVGNTTSPRILPDNQTLVFASDRPGGKGGVDLWLTRRSGDHWSEPENITAVNTPENDYFLSVTMRSIGFLTITTDKGKKAIAELRLPEEFRLNNVIVQQGTLKDVAGETLNGEVRAYNINEASYEARLRVSANDKDFILILPEGAVYDIAYSEIRQNKMYHSERIDATELVAPRREYPNIVLQELEEGLTFKLMGVHFVPNSSEVVSGAELEFSRLGKLLQQHTELKIEVGTYQESYLEDLSPSNPDLTETRIDTSYVYESALRTEGLSNVQKDSILMSINQELNSTMSDTTVLNTYLARMGSIDSVQVQQLNIKYHNNRTPAQAEAVRLGLVNEGVAENRITIVGYKDEEPPVAFDSDQDRVVVIKLLNGLESK